MKPTKLIATYSRVSTARQEEEETIKNQLNILKEFAQKNDYTIVQEYIDEGWSGDILARPSLDKLRQDAKEKIWDGVLIYDPDRLARRYSYQELIMDELSEAGIEVIFVTTPAPKNSEDKILHGVRGLFAEYERAKISERFRLGKLRKIKEGHVMVSEAPYGFHYIVKKEGKQGYYVINEEEARVVKMIFIWIAEDGLTLRKIVRKLHELGIKPRKSKRGVWNTSTLSHLLRNKAYIGEAQWGRSYAVVPENPINKDKYRKMKKSSRRFRPKEEWITIPVPAIIDKKLFMRARAQLDINFKLCKKNRKNEYLLAGKVRCTCGRRRCGEGPQNGKYLYYRCTDRVLNYPLPRVCKEGGINARIADKLVWQQIVKLMSSPELLVKQINRWIHSKQTKAQSSVSDINTIKKDISKLKNQEDRYNKAYGAGLFTIEKLKEYLVPIKERMKTLESQIIKARQVKDHINTTLPNEAEIERFAKKTVKVLNDLHFKEKRAIVMNVIEKIIGTKDKLQVDGYIPITNHVEFFTNDRYCWFAQRWQVNSF